MRITTLIALASFGLARAAPGADTNDSGKLDQTLVGQDTSIVPNAWIVQLDATEDLARLGKRAPWSRRKGDDLDVCLLVRCLGYYPERFGRRDARSSSQIWIRRRSNTT